MRQHLSKVKPFIEFNITQRCNYNCPYCSQGKNNKISRELFDATDDVIDGFVSIVEKVGRDYDIQLIGGEPFIHPKFIETAKRIHELGNKIIIDTNMSFPFSKFAKLIDVTEGNIIIHGALHVSQIRDLDKNIENVININEYLKSKREKHAGASGEVRIVSVLEEANFEILKLIEERLNKAGITFIYIRKILKGKILTYSDSIERYIKLREHKYNIDMLNARKINTKRILCYAGSKIFHVLTDGTIIRCWSYQRKDGFQRFGNVKDPKSIKLFEGPKPCYSPVCYCQHPTARNAYYNSILAPLYHIDYKHIRDSVFSLKNLSNGNKKRKVLTMAGLQIKFKYKEY